MASASRLETALSDGALVLPPEGQIAVFGPPATADLHALPKERVHILCNFRPDHEAWEAAGYDVRLRPERSYAAALVYLPRAKDAARDQIARAALVAPGCVAVDGAKTDGIESLLKAARGLTDVQGVISKAHGKLFWMTPGTAFVDWRGAPGEVVPGFVTAPGVFSADGIDPASQMLAETLPDTLGAHVADLGAGWGYLSAKVLTRPEVERVDLVEADRIALDCARRNISDPRASFHWADAVRWKPEATPDTIVMNPPFHVSRAADPGLGKAFVQAAARLLRPGGRLYLVANRHLPYEDTLDSVLTNVDEIAGDKRFKVLTARRPTRARR